MRVCVIIPPRTGTIRLFHKAKLVSTFLARDHAMPVRQPSAVADFLAMFFLCDRNDKASGERLDHMGLVPACALAA